MLGAIEAGGTKFLVATGDPSGFTQIEIPTTTPEATLRQAIDFLKPYAVRSIGLACFGPVNLRKDSLGYGQIGHTPKLAWRNYDIVGMLQNSLGVPVGLDTDVNAAVLAHHEFGSAKRLANIVYFTVGTGIGAGALVEGRVIHGVAHTEMGHIPIRRHPRDTFGGICPSHGDCLEGLASGPALAARWGQPAESLPAEHPAWDIEAYYLAEAALTASMAYSTDAIVFGGGVLRQPHLIQKVQKEFQRLAAGYLPTTATVIASTLAQPGLLGAFLLAQQISGTTESHEA